MRTLIWFCIRLELILLALAIYWHHYIPKLVPYAKPTVSEECCAVSSYPMNTYQWNNLNDRTACSINEPCTVHSFGVGVQYLKEQP